MPYSESKNSGGHEGWDKEKVSSELKYAKEYLSDVYRVNNLTNLELIRLRQIVEECLKQRQMEGEMVKRGEIDPDRTIDISEAPKRWLLYLYGIERKHIPEIWTVEDKTTGEEFNFFSFDAKQRAGDKVTELTRKGHNHDVSGQVKPEFYEYLRRLREKSHNPPELGFED